MTTPHHTSTKTYPLIVVSWLLFATGVSITVITHWLAISLQWSGPFRDIWELLPGLQSMLAGNFSLEFLLEPYGGAHRMLLTKILVWLDMKFFHGMNYTTLITSLLCLWTSALLIVRSVFMSTSNNRLKFYAAGFVLLYLFSTTQLYNILYAQDSQWFLSLMFSMLAFSFITAPNFTTRHFMLALVCCVFAAFSNGVGILSLPIVAIYYCIHTPEKTKHWLWLILTSAIIAVYYNTEINEHNPVYTSFIHPASLEAWLYFMLSSGYNIVVYTLKYIASPLSRNYLLIGMLTSGWIICSLVILWHNFRHNKQCFLVAHRLLLLLLSWCVLSAIVTATGRLLYLNSATAERFQAVALAGQTAYVLLCLLPPISLPRAWSILNMLTVVFITAGILHAQWPSTQAQWELHSRVMAAHTAARSGITELDSISATLSHPLLMNKRNMVAQYNDYLRDNNLGYHHQDPSIALHQQIAVDNLPLCSQQTPLAEQALQKETWLIRGKFDDAANTSRADDLIILNDAHTIVGYAYAAQRIFLSGEMSYTGYANAALFTGNGTMTGMKNNKPVCANTISLRNTAEEAQ